MPGILAVIGRGAALGRQALFVVPAMLVLFLSCVSSSGTAIDRRDCGEDPRLLGSWRSQRASQVGPASMTLRFECGCVYRTATGVLLMRIRETGNYRVEEGTLVFTRPSENQTRWPYRFEGETLRIEEHPDEVHEYRRTGRLTCP